jgi:hypothetical protein
MSEICKQAAATHGTKKRPAADTNFNFPKEMQHILREKAKERNISGASDMDDANVTRAIIKDAKTDKRFQALIIANRLAYCSTI